MDFLIFVNIKSLSKDLISDLTYLYYFFPLPKNDGLID